MISIVVAIYNVAPYLGKCIESLTGQTYKEIEIILVDDGSVDDCYDICEKYGQKDERIRVIHKKNGGVVSARKAGLQLAKGTYIAFVDGDDWVEPDMYEILLKKMEKEQVDVVMCGRYEDTGASSRKVYHGIPEGRYDKSKMLKEVYPRMLVGGDFFQWGIFPGMWDKLFPREFIYTYQMNVDDSIIMGDDAACVYPCLLCADSIYVVGECLYHYRQTTVSAIKQVRCGEEERRKYQILFESVNRFFADHACTYDLRKQWAQYLTFLMVPRSDCLYQGFDKLDYLFPFPKVKRGSGIVLYCAGTYGQILYQYLQRTQFCKVTAWVDQNYPELGRQGLPVENPKVIADREYDAIVIANMFSASREEILRNLKTDYPDSKIYGIDESWIMTKDTMKAFGLIDAV